MLMNRLWNRTKQKNAQEREKYTAGTVTENMKMTEKRTGIRKHEDDRKRNRNQETRNRNSKRNKRRNWILNEKKKKGRNGNRKH
jgi:hypothetical protein